MIRVFQLRCDVKNYQWGKIGHDSEVSQLASGGCSDIVIDSETPYAELWMGTHVSGPSMAILPDGKQVSLESWLTRHPEQLGEKVTKQFGSKLPFLFKVLSVRNALSIQAHPNKAHAERLHRQHPDIYKDDNHKPEMAIALTPFHCLCGFRPVGEIAKFIHNIPEFTSVLGKEACHQLLEAESSGDEAKQRRAIKCCLTSILNQSTDLIKQESLSLEKRMKSLPAGGQAAKIVLADVFLKVHNEFPGDVGCFVAFLLNRMILQPGEAIFLPANFPHAYLSGDCVECMACSDNVVRAGLTPKLIDKATLVDMLDYSPQSPSQLYKRPEETVDQASVLSSLYKPPLTDFAVTRIQIPAGVKHASLPALDSASVCIVIRGCPTAKLKEIRLSLNRGNVFYVAANTTVNIINVSSEMLIFRAFCNV